MEYNQTHAKHLFTHKCQTLNILIFLLNLILILFYKQLLSAITAQVIVKVGQKLEAKLRKKGGRVCTKKFKQVFYSAT